MRSHHVVGVARGEGRRIRRDPIPDLCGPTWRILFGGDLIVVLCSDPDHQRSHPRWVSHSSHRWSNMVAAAGPTTDGELS